MSDVAIRAEGLSKWYRIGAVQRRSRRFGDALSQFVTAPYRRLKERMNGDRNKNTDSIWALKDSDVEVNDGEVVGIIGRNGAGQSTLFNLISRITDPTHGYVDI